MANPQHIEWLLEGVDRWNYRRTLAHFTPDFEGADLQEIFRKADLLSSGYRIPLVGVNLTGANCASARLQGADFHGANLKEAELTAAHLWMAKLSDANLESAILVGAVLEEADLIGANLENAILRRANLQGANAERSLLKGADLENADVRTVVFRKVGAAYGGKAVSADLSKAESLTQEQVDSMIGDGGTILPSELERPAHWPEVDLEEGPEPAQQTPPPLPSEPMGNQVDLSDAALTLGPDATVPERPDLAILFKELRHTIAELQALGGLHNLSPLFAKGMDRFLNQLPETFEDIEQTRFGVGTQMMRFRFDAEKASLEREAPEKSGYIEAIIYLAELVAKRLPDWQAFLLEETEDAKVFEARKDEARQVLEDAAEGLARSPETFDASLFARIREYLEDASIVGYLAAKELLLSIAHRTFSLSLDLTKETVSEFRKGIIKNIATALQVELGAVLLDLAGLLPAELHWLVSWLEYLPQLLK